MDEAVTMYTHIHHGEADFRMQISDRYKEYKHLVHEDRDESIDHNHHPLGQKEGRKVTKAYRIFNIPQIEKAGGGELRRNCEPGRQEN
jgi:hypothetical protein